MQTDHIVQMVAAIATVTFAFFVVVQMAAAIATVTFAFCVASTSSVEEKLRAKSRRAHRSDARKIIMGEKKIHYCSKKEQLQEIMKTHSFKAYLTSEIDELVKVINLLVTKEDRYASFPGMAWLFLKNETCHQLVNWTDSLPMQRLDAKSLLSHWCSREVDAHDGCGVFGNVDGMNVLVSLGVILKSELDEIAHLINEEDRNRTGFTSAFFAAFKTDAVVLKVSETRAITLFAKGPHGSIKPKRVHLDEVHAELTAALGA